MRWVDDQWRMDSLQDHSVSHRNEFTNVHWQLDFDTGDLIVGQSFYPSSFAITPFGGIRYARITQKLRLKSVGTLKDTEGTSFIFGAQHHRQRYWGLGLLLGLGANWDLGCGFGAFGSVDGVALRGHLTARCQDSLMQMGTIDYYIDQTRRLAWLYGLDVAAGISFDQCLCDDLHITFKFTLEHHGYFDFNKMGCSGDLSLDGVAFSTVLSY